MNPALIWGIAKYAAIAIALYFCYQAVDNHWATDAGIAEGIKRQKVKTDQVKGEYDSFVLTVKLEGDKAKAVAEQRTIAEKQDKEKKDASLKMLRGDLDNAITNLVRERAARASSGYLPPASAAARDPKRATLDRAKFESAMGLIDERGAGIAAAGDRYRIGLDSLKGEPK